MDLDVRKMVMGVVSVIIALIVVMSCAIPVISGLNDSVTNTYTNSDGMRASLLDLSGTHTVVSDGVTYTIDDGTPITVPNYQVGMASDLFNGRRFGNAVQWASPFGSSITGYLDLTIVDGVVNGTLTSTATSNVYTFTDQKINYLAYMDSNGNYTMMFSDTQPRSIYLNDPSEQYYSANYLNTTSQWFSYYDGALTVGGVANDTMTFTGQIMDYDTEVYRYTTTQDDIVFTVDNNGEDYVVHPYVCVVPYQVTGMTENNHTIMTIVNIIPVLMIIAVLIGAVTLFINIRRN